MSVSSQKWWVSGPEIEALDTLENPLDYMVYHKAKRWCDKETMVWNTSVGQIMAMTKSTRGEVRGSIERIINAGLFVKSATQGKDGGIVLTCCLAGFYTKSANHLQTISPTISPTGCGTIINVPENVDLSGLNDDAQMVANHFTNHSAKWLEGRYATTSTIKIKNKNKKIQNTHNKILIKQQNAQAVIRAQENFPQEDEQGWSPEQHVGIGEHPQPTASQHKKISAQTETQHPQPKHVASEGAVSSDSGVEPPLGASWGSTQQQAQGLSTGNGIGVICDAGAEQPTELGEIAMGILELRRWFKLKPGIAIGVLAKIDRRHYDASFRAWQQGGLTVNEIKEACLMDDVSSGRLGSAPGWYNPAITQAIMDKKNPPALGSVAGNVSGLHSQVRNGHHDLTSSASQVKSIEITDAMAQEAMEDFGMSLTGLQQMCARYLDKGGATYVADKMRIVKLQPPNNSVSMAVKLSGACKRDDPEPKFSRDAIAKETVRKREQEEAAKRATETLEASKKQYDVYVRESIMERIKTLTEDERGSLLDECRKSTYVPPGKIFKLNDINAGMSHRVFCSFIRGEKPGLMKDILNFNEWSVRQ